MAKTTIQRNLERLAQAAATGGRPQSTAASRPIAVSGSDIFYGQAVEGGIQLEGADGGSFLPFPVEAVGDYDPGDRVALTLWGQRPVILGRAGGFAGSDAYWALQQADENTQEGVREAWEKYDEQQTYLDDVVAPGLQKAQATADGKALIHYGTNPPSTPKSGDFWWNQASGSSQIYTGTGWRSTVPGDGFVPALDIGAATAGMLSADRVNVTGELWTAMLAVAGDATISGDLLAEDIVGKNILGSRFIQNVPEHNAMVTIETRGTGSDTSAGVFIEQQEASGWEDFQSMSVSIDDTYGPSLVGYRRFAVDDTEYRHILKSVLTPGNLTIERTDQDGFLAGGIEIHPYTVGVSSYNHSWDEAYWTDIIRAANQPPPFSMISASQPGLAASHATSVSVDMGRTWSSGQYLPVVTVQGPIGTSDRLVANVVELFPRTGMVTVRVKNHTTTAASVSYSLYVAMIPRGDYAG